MVRKGTDFVLNVESYMVALNPTGQDTEFLNHAKNAAMSINKYNIVKTGNVLTASQFARLIVDLNTTKCSLCLADVFSLKLCAFAVSIICQGHQIPCNIVRTVAVRT